MVAVVIKVLGNFISNPSCVRVLNVMKILLIECEADLFLHNYVALIRKD